MNNWDYKEFYKKYNMTGVIEIGTGKIKVHDIYNELPSFMYEADTIFSDPPCSLGNINSFYTKADLEKRSEYESFVNRFFKCIALIKPKIVFIEVFKANEDRFIAELQKLFKNLKIYNSTYYHKSDCKCKILVASNDDIIDYPFENVDEQDVIKYICQNTEYNCIGDLCMGKGLVGFYANQVGKKFVGTELNKKRLAVLIERINKGSLLNIK